MSARKPARGAITLRGFQQEAVDALAAAGYDTLAKIARAPSQAERIAREQGHALLVAPTGAGKTVMLAAACEAISLRTHAVWFWFAPFASVVDQTAGTMNLAAPVLRVRNPMKDREAIGTRAGDVFLATWASVAARREESRKARRDDDAMNSIDSLLEALHGQGIPVGVVVDEAHHSFNPGTEAFRFFTGVLRPRFVMLATATPGDEKMEVLRRALDVRRFNIVSIARERVVEAHLNKEEVRAITFVAGPAARQLVDLNEVALRAAVTRHRELKEALARARTGIVPLLLVQAASASWTPDRVRTLLHVQLGFPLEAVGVHTADEPDADVQAMAQDPQVEVLVFKMAVATGFDAPRAFTLCALRPVREAAFGLQVIGRIMRVHRALQPWPTIPKELNTGWVFLGDAEGQGGLLDAAARIKAIRDEISTIADAVHVSSVTVDGEGLLSIQGDDGQFGFALEPPRGFEEAAPGIDRPPPSGEGPSSANPAARVAGLLNTSLFGPSELPEPPEQDSREDAAGRPAASQPAAFRYPRRVGVQAPDALMTEKMPRDAKPLLEAVARNVSFAERHLLLARRVSVAVEQRDVELFSQQARFAEAQGEISEFYAREAAHRVLRTCDHLAPDALGRALIERLQAAMASAGLPALTEREARRGLNVILSQSPELLRDALRRAVGACVEPVHAAPLPHEWPSPVALEPSPLNLYGVMPRGMNSWETAFARWLDRQSQYVEWWLRNVPNPNSPNDWGSRIALPDARGGFYPDFVIGVRGRKAGLLLAETKERMESEDTLIKSRTEHRSYGRVLMIAWQEQHERFIRFEFDFATGFNVAKGVLEQQHLVDH